MGKAADPADISVLFFPAGANFWHMHTQYISAQMVLAAPEVLAASLMLHSSTTGASRIGKCHNLRCFVANLTILSQMGKCRNLRVFGANFLGAKFASVLFNSLFPSLPFQPFLYFKWTPKTGF